ncbi:MAG TPA: efflux RND transporter periplasmic adaptor subunit, partial [Isosphaeraceae bacterium]|nr:efflux RND transporter periplasmic adaptor subunit [Isosphaeraceae bacterium]
MSVVLSQTQTSRERRTIRPILPWAGMVLCLALMAGHIAYDVLGPARLHAASRSSESQPGSPSEPPSKSPALGGGSSVTLPESKVRTAKIASEPARIDRLATEVAVPGLIQANADRQVEIRPRAAGIVREVHARLGQTIHRGETLLVLDSPDIGTARLNLRQRQRELVTARFEANWKSEIAGNIALLIPELRKGIARRSTDVTDAHHENHLGHEERPRDDMATIERRFTDKQLGTYRGTLLQALAEYDIAAHEEEKTASLRNQKIVGVHPMLVALHTRQGVQAKLEAAIEQVRYDAAQEKRLADQALRQAEAAVIDAAQRLRILGVAEDIPSLLAHPEQANAIAINEDVTVYTIVAPFDGTILKKNAVPSQRVEPSDVLYTLADLRSVWVSASVNESVVAQLPRIQDGSI